MWHEREVRGSPWLQLCGEFICSSHCCIWLLHFFFCLYYTCCWYQSTCFLSECFAHGQATSTWDPGSSQKTEDMMHLNMMRSCRWITESEDGHHLLDWGSGFEHHVFIALEFADLALNRLHNIMFLRSSSHDGWVSASHSSFHCF